MTKTQPSVLKQCISRTLFLFVFLGGLPHAWAYTSVAPFESAADPASGLVFGPALALESLSGVNSGGSSTSQTDLNFNLAAALSSDFSIYGRYSVQNDQRLGLGIKLFEKSGTELRSQIETTLNPDSTLGVTLGLFGTTPLLLKGLPSFRMETGFAFAYATNAQTVHLPLSFMLLHGACGNFDHFANGFFYGAGLSAEISPSDNQNWFSFRAIAGYETRSSLQYFLSASAPLVDTGFENDASISLGLVIPFGGSESQKTFTPKTNPAYSESVPGRYDLDAKITSMNEALFLLKIDKGSSDSVEKGQTFDIYSGEQFIARAQVISVKIDEAALNVVEYKQEHWIELGFSARRLGE